MSHIHVYGLINHFPLLCQNQLATQMASGYHDKLGMAGMVTGNTVRRHQIRSHTCLVYI